MVSHQIHHCGPKVQILVLCQTLILGFRHSRLRGNDTKTLFFVLTMH
jgi:hypothetical protein